MEAPIRTPNGLLRRSVPIVAAGLAALVSLLVSSVPSLAHDDLDRQIAYVSRQIERNPRDPDLYLKRAELSRLDAAWRDAEADVDRAERLAPKAPAVAMCRAALWLDRGDPERADSLLVQVLERTPGRSDAFVLRARIAAARGASATAEEHFDRALAAARRSTPDLYLERARLVSALDPGGRERALGGLDEGITRLGPAAGLMEAAIDLELVLGRWDAALARLDRLSAHAAHPEVSLARRGRILESAGRPVEAWAAYTAALAALESSPADWRATGRSVALESQIRAALRVLPTQEAR